MAHDGVGAGHHAGAHGRRRRHHLHPGHRRAVRRGRGRPRRRARGRSDGRGHRPRRASERRASPTIPAVRDLSPGAPEITVIACPAHGGADDRSAGSASALAVRRVLAMTGGSSRGCVGRAGQPSEGWVSLFDGKSLDGWKVGENASTFSVAEGAIVVAGPRAHLFYVGPVKQSYVHELRVQGRGEDDVRIRTPASISIRSTRKAAGRQRATRCR